MTNFKFRVWDKKRKSFLDGGEIIFRLYGEYDFSVIPNQIGYYSDDIEDYYSNDNRNRYKIMQSTGLTDKNGKEIFEGDIIKNNKGKIYEIQFLYGAFYAYTIKIDTNQDNGKSLYLLEDIVDVSEIIGNIYENRELLNS